MISIELTEEEAEVVSNYVFRKVCKLEDSYCYPRLYSAYHKIYNALQNAKKEG